MKIHEVKLININELKTDTKLCKCGCGTIIKSRNRNGELFYDYGHTWRGRKRIEENRNQAMNSKRMT